MPTMEAGPLVRAVPSSLVLRAADERGPALDPLHAAPEVDPAPQDKDGKRSDPDVPEVDPAPQDKDGGQTSPDALQGLGLVGPGVEVTTSHACMHEEAPEVAGALLEKANSGALATPLSSKEIIATGNIKTFCAGLLKKLAPPLLKEFEGLSGVRVGQDPFTPRRATRSGRAIGQKMKTKASVAETVLLKALGFSCEDLAVSDDALEQLRTVFDSPLQEPQLRAIAAIFGKAIPLDLGADTELAAPIMV